MEKGGYRPTSSQLAIAPVAAISVACQSGHMLLFLLGSLAISSASPAVQRITPQEAARRVSQCGLGPVTTHYERDLQEDVLVASSAQSATDDQLACAYKVVGFYYTLDLPPNVQPRFDAMRGATAEVWTKAQARDWLSTRGLLRLLPKINRGVTDDGAFTREIEVMCGRQARGAFQSKYGFHALNPDWVRQLGLPPKRKGMETLSCLMNATTVAGFKFGIIGNEAFARPH